MTTSQRLEGMWVKPNADFECDFSFRIQREFEQRKYQEKRNLLVYHSSPSDGKSTLNYCTIKKSFAVITGVLFAYLTVLEMQKEIGKEYNIF